ncbi:hypothetical protein BU26DRAFT_447070 [Trematosphaeria pertusa]|uniref:Uncharacterized protein n=1 Tax=Trematosphaeria pertusa TaxID=390896 RepID=A0A6A6IXH9_9PLEO|nr:uncharacterized protein BU26DRAFT_447070 [Trematosphaeria pertusa]KAF2254330.1 hypothetical protein BU26DRAFT_447070 [Trematosphaeria pertusa]
MDTHLLLRQLLRAPSTYRTILTPTMARPQTRTFALLSPQLSLAHPRHLSLPRIIQPSFWTSMIPRPLKERPSKPKKTREINPATPYIVLGLLVGSQAIQILWLKQERGREMRRAEAKIGVLREVVERVQRGEDVDVERVLRTGDQEGEGEWADVLKEIEEEELLFQGKKVRKALKQQAAAAAAAKEEGKMQKEPENEVESKEVQEGKVKVETVNGARFY